MFVTAKVANQRALLARYLRRSGLPLVIGAVQALEESMEAATTCGDIDALRGVEGAAARVYFQAFGELLPGWCDFKGRSKRPPKDPVNAVLSYLYTVVVGDAIAACLTAGLDPATGFLHDDRGRRPSLACDLIEEFRPVIVDTVALELFRRNSLHPNQFETNEHSGGVAIRGKPARRCWRLSKIDC